MLELPSNYGPSDRWLRNGHKQQSRSYALAREALWQRLRDTWTPIDVTREQLDHFRHLRPRRTQVRLAVDRLFLDFPLELVGRGLRWHEEGTHGSREVHLVPPSAVSVLIDKLEQPDRLALANQALGYPLQEVEQVLGDAEIEPWRLEFLEEDEAALHLTRYRLRQLYADVVQGTLAPGLRRHTLATLG
jgi:hypothetical protein